jgi:hypothetical protein
MDCPNSYLMPPELNPNLKTRNYCARDASVGNVYVSRLKSLELGIDEVKFATRIN